MREFTNIVKALSDESRVRIFMLLQPQELCVCQILEVFDLAPSTVSKHLSVLYQAGLLESRKDGRWVYYRHADGNASGTVQRALKWVTDAIGADPQIQTDRKRLDEVLKMSPEELCKLQTTK